jgi:hypothetical protein
MEELIVNWGENYNFLLSPFLRRSSSGWFFQVNSVYDSRLQLGHGRRYKSGGLYGELTI